ncbi:hypothetical protein SAMN05421503_2466 [Terribacillus aidingensis]|uniref:Uncharacterized protein n=1 Tax=Terribacillus aidingensis TaxID=586416 RepID=A0A285NYI2_9BACI|nr:hypothetical protein [Terribacillus aidingensis]SNZ14544.1 hypothetical protein SAMN05421503_2466 [Terribacillus aidingensis]
MKIILKQPIQLKDEVSADVEILFKELESEFVPRVGERVTDDVYRHYPDTGLSRVVDDVEYTHNLKKCKVTLKYISIPRDSFGNCRKTFHEFGWTDDLKERHSISILK